MSERNSGALVSALQLLLGAEKADAMTQALVAQREREQAPTPVPEVAASQEFKFTRQDVNISGLCEELQEVLGDALEGVAQRGDQITVQVRPGVEVQSGVLDAIMQVHKGGESADERQMRQQREAIESLRATDFRQLQAILADGKDTVIPQVLVTLTGTMMLLVTALGYATLNDAER